METNLEAMWRELATAQEELATRNKDLEVENAALWAFVRTARQYEDGYYAQMGETDAGIAMFEAFQALHLAGFPWTEGKS
jgi:hypothetical protein